MYNKKINPWNFSKILFVLFSGLSEHGKIIFRPFFVCVYVFISGSAILIHHSIPYSPPSKVGVWVHILSTDFEKFTKATQISQFLADIAPNLAKIESVVTFMNFRDNKLSFTTETRHIFVYIVQKLFYLLKQIENT